MASSAACSTVRIAPSGVVRIRFSDGTELEFHSWADLSSWVLELDTIDVARRVLLAWWIARNPDGSNPNLIEGKTGTWDLSAPNVFRVQ